MHQRKFFSNEAAAAEASIGWLLDPAASVRGTLVNTLDDAARKGKVTPTMLRRIIAMRNWLPEDSRAALDVAIATARRKGVPSAQWDDVDVRQLTCTGVDGSGAIGVLAHCRSKRKNVIGSLLLKHGFGVRDAWAREGRNAGLDRAGAHTRWLRALLRRSAPAHTAAPKKWYLGVSVKRNRDVSSRVRPHQNAG